MDEVSKQLVPDSYHLQDGCWNCRHVVLSQCPDAGRILHCGFRLPLPPQEPSESSYAARETYYDLRDDWEDGRDVKAEGICGKYNK